MAYFKHIKNGIFLLLLPVTLYAYPSHTEITLGLGAISANLNTMQLPVSEDETDTLHSKGNTWDWIETVGISQHFFVNSQLINDAALGLNLYHFYYKSTGDVYLFGESSLNDLHYQLPIQSTRLMLDGKLSAAICNPVRPFIIAGIGLAYNSVSYKDTPVTDDVNGISLTTRKQTKFAYELGIGVERKIADSVSLFFEYLYADVGDLESSSFGNPDIYAPIKHTLHTNSLLAGINISI